MEHKKEAYKRSGNLVHIKKPTFEELEYTKKLWSDYDTMKDIGGVFELNERRKQTFYKKMVNPTDGKNFYCIVYTNDGKPVGEASFHGYDSANKIARLNIKIQNCYRGNGYGTEAARLLLEYYFYEFSGDIIIDNKVTTKEAEITLKKLGFKSSMQSCYRITKDEFTKKSSMKKKEIGIVAFDGVSMSKLGIVAECLIACNKNDEEVASIDLLSNSDMIKANSGIEINIEEKISDRKKYNVLIFPDGIDIRKQSETTKKIFKKMIEEAEYIIAMDNSISILLELCFLKGMNIILPENLIDRYKTDIWNYNLLNESYVDNGKFILFKGIKGVIDGSLYLIEKIYGRSQFEQIKNKI